MRRLNWQIWQRFWRVAHPYWVSGERLFAIALLVFVVLLSSASSGFVVLETLQRGEVVSSLVSRNLDRFWHALLLFLVIVLITVPVLALKSYVQAKLALYWRRWLTNRFLNRYFDAQTFYHVSNHPDIDNPDQRIAEDIDNFTKQSLVFFGLVVDSSLQIVGFAGILWSISPILMAILMSYVFAGTVLTSLVFGRVLIKINFEQLKLEADFRYGLARVRENAEAIAFYQGEAQEIKHLQQRFLAAFHNFSRLIRWQLSLTVFQNGYQYLTFLLPFVLLAPRIFSGELEVGAVTQSQAAFERLGAIFGIIIMQFDKLSAFGAAVNRLERFSEVMHQLAQNSTKPTIQTIFATDLSIHQLTLITPDSRKPLLKNLSLTVGIGQSLLITGASGLGKTSLLRAIGGLWQLGSGTIARPERSQLLFLPQRPYLIPGSLRQQLLYPHLNSQISDSQLMHVLQQVNLVDIAYRFGGLDSVADWSVVLSGGEQQRLAFARLLLTQPQYALLDEATSALDEENEQQLYQLLQTLPLSVISVGHRFTLVPYHQQVLQFTGEGAWELMSAEQYKLEQEL
jgi:vitamin B12/bleomycin/antimicrobial peptide transport system ATP-binding/permease protein